MAAIIAVVVFVAVWIFIAVCVRRGRRTRGWHDHHVDVPLHGVTGFDVDCGSGGDSGGGGDGGGC